VGGVVNECNVPKERQKQAPKDQGETNPYWG
jgi:hypothetical protein